MNTLDEVTNGGFLISKIQKLGKRIFARILKEHDLKINPGQGRILFILWQIDRIPIQELAKRTSLTTSTLTSMLDRMENAKMLVRIPKPGDRRSYLIQLTPETKKMRQKFLTISSEMTKIYYNGLNQREIREFEGVLSKILYNLEIYDKN